MRVLGIETSGEYTGIALCDDGGARAELAFRHRMQLSRQLVPRVEELLSVAGLDLSELQGIAVCVGPGSFTGLRIGVTVAKSLAYARKLPLTAVGSLEALAAETFAAEGAALWTVISAGRGLLFAAAYRRRGEASETLREPAMLEPEAVAGALRAAVADGPVTVAGPAGLQATLAPPEHASRLAWRDAEAPRPATIARLGRLRLLAGERAEVHALAPRYLRPSAAEARRGEAACETS